MTEQKIFHSMKRLSQLRNENRITESEYKKLSKACLAIWVKGQFQEIMLSFMYDAIKTMRNA